MDTRNFICINCPMGCNLEVNIEDGKYKVFGNNCVRGIEYALSEITNPKRVITTSVFVNSGTHTTVSVKTSREIPKELIFKCIEELAAVKVDAPVKSGDVIVRNILDTGADVVATRSVDKRLGISA